MSVINNFTAPVQNVQFFSDQVKIDYRHNSYLFILVLEGKAQITHEKEQFILKTGDIYFRSHVSEGYISSFAQSSILVVSFSPEFMTSHIPAYSLEFIVNSSQFPNKQNNTIISLILDITYQYLTNEPNHLKLISLSYALLDELNKNHVIIPDHAHGTEEKNALRIRRAANYVNSNYSSHITLSDMAKILYISPQHCSRFFKQFFDMSFLEYLNYIRLQHALEQIQYGDESITQIAFQNGFPNLSSFNRVFKKHQNTTPNEYRKTYKMEKLEEGPPPEQQTPAITLEGLKRYEHHLNLVSPIREGAEKIQTRHFDNDGTGHGILNFDNILNLGLLSDCLMHNYYIQISEMQASLNFRYARFHGMLDESVISKIPNTGKYNYQYVDMIFDHFQEIGLTPFIELGNIPQRLSFSLSELEPLVDSDDVANSSARSYLIDYDKLRHVLKHCIYRYGSQAVENWYFEIWMDFEQYAYISDLDIDLVLDAYIEHYIKCRNAIKTLLPNANVGGPGFNAVASFSVLNKFFKKAALRDVELDFITAFLYPYKVRQKGGVSKEEVAENVIVGDEDTILNRLSYIYDSVRHSSYSKQPVFIPEYHFSVSPRNHMNDSCFQACFILKTLLEGQENVRGFGYYRALDISTNYSDIIAPIFGGPGFITKDNIKKPSYYAYLFLNNIRGELIDRGEGYILTKVSGNKYRLLLYYYVHPEADFLLQPKNYPPRYYTEKLCPSGPKKKYDISIGNMANSDYLIKNRFLNSKYGSILNEWVMLNSSPYLSRNDISYLRNICVPHQTIETVSCENNTVSFSATLMPHEIRSVEITPLSET